MGISLVINTLNEETNIGDCIDSVGSLADEIVVCDMHSADRTAEIATHKGARVILHPRVGFVEPARRFAISQACHEWVLVLDADERMTPQLAERLIQVTRDDACDVVSFWSLYWYFGGWVRHGGFFAGAWRFFKQKIYLDTYRSTDERVHCNFQSLRSASRVLQLSRDYFIRHYAYDTIEKYITKTIGMYARIEAEEYANSGKKFSMFRLIGEPLREFLVRYILRQGFRDGMRGFILACLFSGFRFAVWANIWFMKEDRRSRELNSKNSVCKNPEI